jgi:hypothetical protein
MGEVRVRDGERGQMRGRVVRRLAAGVGASVLAAGAMAGVASGQILNNQGAGVGNSGGASASTGSNSATGNGSTNTAATSNTGSGTGGLLGALLTLGGPTNTSTGSANVATGPASGQGNGSSTGVGQAQGGGGNGLFNNQSATVSNSGSADASTGGNTAVGNGSTNTATIVQNASGLLGVNVNLGSPTNVSSGTANIITGPASAVGNVSNTGISQDSGGGGAILGTLAGTQLVDGRLVSCGRFNSQGASVDNSGIGTANTGGNTAIGNDSTNTATVANDLGSGLLDAPISLGAPTNTSSGTADIATGAASALGNQSSTGISQQQCVTPVAAVRAGPSVAVPLKATQTGALALTGQNPVQFAAAGGGLFLVGYALVRGTRRRRRVYLP